MSDIHTDLALEAREILEGRDAQQIPGVEAEVNRDVRDITITRVRVTSNAGEMAIGKPRGLYVTLEAPSLRDRDPTLEERVSYCLARELKPLLPPIDRNFTALVVGLGNWNITPDALGPRVVSKMMITRPSAQGHPDQVDERVRPVCALAPGVLGITGIETAEIIQGVVEKITPSVVFRYRRTGFPAHRPHQHDHTAERYRPQPRFGHRQQPGRAGPEYAGRAGHRHRRADGCIRHTIVETRSTSWPRKRPRSACRRTTRCSGCWIRSSPKSWAIWCDSQEIDTIVDDVAEWFPPASTCSSTTA
jgi:hypothetical protein